MARYRFGEEQCRFFYNPLPALIAGLRRELSRHLAPIANDIAAKLPGDVIYPPSLEAFHWIFHAAGQAKPKSLLLRYGAGGYNRLHQGFYCAVHFPLQAVFLLNRREVIFTGGVFMLLEQQPGPITYFCGLSSRQWYHTADPAAILPPYEPVPLGQQKETQWLNRLSWKFSPITFDRGVISVPGVLKN